MNRLNQLKNIQNEAAILFEKKNNDYGDAFANHGAIGVLVRIGDKIKRLEKITSTNISLVDDEKLRDTLIDLHNYAAMAIMLIDEIDDINVNDDIDVNDNLNNDINDNLNNDVNDNLNNDVKNNLNNDVKNNQDKCGHNGITCNII